MSRISDCFRHLAARHKTALIGFITAGDPEPGITVPLMHAMADAGADIIELGVPFSDPMADGPVIQRANERALRHGVSLRDVMDMVREFRMGNQDTPVVLMGYLNPVEALGYAAFASQAKDSGVDGVITVDMPPEEAGEYLTAMRSEGVDAIFLLAPTSGQQRISGICKAASGFVYYVSLKGTTGAATPVIVEVAAKVSEIRKHTNLPVGVGFGIKDPESAQAMAQVGDAVIVGSVLVSKIENSLDDPQAITPAVVRILSDMRSAMDLI